MPRTHAPLPARPSAAVIAHSSWRAKRAALSPRAPRLARVRRLLVPLILAGCATGIGPRTVARDRFDYSSAIGSSWRNQMLLNIVKLRYLDPPTFLKVEQILAGYTVEGTASAGWGQAVRGSASPGWFFSGRARYTDRPTVTFRPLTGAEMGRNLMTPIEPHTILYLLQGGYSADLVFPLCVQSINGLRNRGRKQADEGFLELVRDLKVAYVSGALSMRIVRGDEDTSTLMTFQPRSATEEGLAASRRVRQLLRLDPDAHEFTVRYGTSPGGGREVVMLTRSALGIMLQLATAIDVPEEDAESVFPVPYAVDHSLIHIRSTPPEGEQRPYVEVAYRGRTYWLDDGDLLSKRTFIFLKLLFNFVETGGTPAPTLVTVPG